MEITANHVNVEQLVALIEARQFPIGVDFTDPLAQRLYDSMAVLMCQASIACRQASIARRYINTAMSEMGNNQGGYYQLKKCLEEMNAQGQGETADVVLCKQYREELNDVVPAAKAMVVALRDFAVNVSSALPVLDTTPGLEAYAKEIWRHGEGVIALARDSADVLEQLMGFNTAIVPPQGGVSA